MLRNSSIAILILCFFCGLLSAADLPTSAQNALDKANADIAKVRQVLIKELTKAQDVATKKGDLDGALAIKTEIENQTKEISTAVDLLGNSRAPGKKTWATGSWEVSWGGYRTVITFEKEGVVKRTDGVNGKMVLSDTDTATITWDADVRSGGTVWTIQAPEKGNSEIANGKNMFGTQFKAMKQ